MLPYYLGLARRSLGRNFGLTILMILAIAFGVGASMTTLTVLHVLGQDPIPGKSHDLYMVQVEPRRALGAKPDSVPPEQLPILDGQELLRAQKAEHQALMTGGQQTIEPQRTDLKPFMISGRWTTTDFFKMFDVPFLAGGAWSEDDDKNKAHVVVVSKELADKVFGSTAVVGKSLRVGGQELRIVGVTDTWAPAPHFYDLHVSVFGEQELMYVPFFTAYDLKFGHSGSMDCWQDSPDSMAVGAPCVWTQFWVELHGSERVEAYRQFLIHYSEDAKKAGRYERAPNVLLRDVIEWLAYKRVVPDDARLQSWIALGFLVVCLINTVGLLLTKFLRRSSEIGVRRALGASKRAIFFQLLVEAGAIGLVGGAIGLGLAWLGLFAVRHQPTTYAQLAQLDLPMLAATFALAIVSSLLAGVLPAWRGCQISPAAQLKSH